MPGPGIRRVTDWEAIASEGSPLPHTRLPTVRHIIRVLLTSAFVASLAVAGMAGAALAAPGGGNGTSYEMYEDMCLEDGSILLCFEVHGRFTVVDQDNGDQIANTAVRTVSYVVEGGVVSSANIDHSVYQTKIVDGFFQDELVISQSRSLTPGEQCVAHLLLKLEDGEVVVDQASMSCT
jgi:hypothetical protein